MWQELDMEFTMNISDRNNKIASIHSRMRSGRKSHPVDLWHDRDISLRGRVASVSKIFFELVCFGPDIAAERLIDLSSTNCGAGLRYLCEM